MFLSDGGNVPFSALSDQFTTHKWDDLGFTSHSLWGISASDFEVIDGGNRIALTYDCVRNDIPLETCPRKLTLPFEKFRIFDSIEISQAHLSLF